MPNFSKDHNSGKIKYWLKVLGRLQDSFRMPELLRGFMLHSNICIMLSLVSTEIDCVISETVV